MNTQKLKELARRATGGIWKAFINEKTNTFAIHTPDDARCGNIVDWMGFDGVNCSKKQKAHNARFIAASNPAVVIQLIEALEAAERERDELREQFDKLASAAGWSKEQCEQVGESPFDVVEELVSAKRERDEAIAAHRKHAASLIADRGLLRERAEAAEAELARRDEEAGEPFAYIDSAHLDEFGWGYVFKHSSPMRMACESPVYTAAQPAVLPPAMTYAEALKASDWKNDQASIWVEGANWMRQQCLELGAQQQQKVVALDNVFSVNVAGVAVRVVLLKDVSTSLDAANVKWEVKS